VVVLNSTSYIYQHLPDYSYEANAFVDIQDIDSILENTLSQMADTVTEPNFGTNFGEWSVLCLARGGYYSIDDEYFSNYYDRIVETVNEKADSVNKNGALHKVKSTENSRLIVALSSIGINAESVGNWNLITPYNDFDWIKKQGINGPIWTLIALDTQNYQTSDPTVKQQCIDYILGLQFDDGGWAMSGETADPDITAMALQALARYTDDENVKASVERGINCISDMQKENGGYYSWGTINSESIAQVIVACTALGIDPATDERFVKNGFSAIDAILEFYNPDFHNFSHITGDGGNAMATDQATYALIAYKRFVDGRNSLYDMSDAPDKDNSENPDNNKLPDSDSEADNKDNVDDDNTKFNEDFQNDNNNNDNNEQAIVVDTSVQQTFSTTSMQTTFINTSVQQTVSTTTMATTTSYQSATDSTITTETTTATTSVPEKITFSVVCLYKGDDMDIISSSEMAVAIAVKNAEQNVMITYDDGKHTAEFLYNEDVSEKLGFYVYTALVDSDMDMNKFTESNN
ncbi:MAG: terpene cyclase/mutase family protein, partial [Ruminococcus sp.]|nr:terpene cyclase/mutase family protein [Ruminococcus sp.]